MCEAQGVAMIEVLPNQTLGLEEAAGAEQAHRGEKDLSISITEMQVNFALNVPPSPLHRCSFEPVRGPVTCENVPMRTSTNLMANGSQPVRRESPTRGASKGASGRLRSAAVRLVILIATELARQDAKSLPTTISA
jgi:hypothetical protein